MVADSLFDCITSKGYLCIVLNLYNMYVTIFADIVSSISLSQQDMVNLKRRLEKFFSLIEMLNFVRLIGFLCQPFRSGYYFFLPKCCPIPFSIGCKIQVPSDVWG